MSDNAILAFHDPCHDGGCELLPLLPLPHMVLLPGEELELHVFAPRYCALVRASLALDRRLVVSTIRPEHLVDPPEHPAVERVACTAHISRAEALPDGTYFVWLDGEEGVLLSGDVSREEGFRRVRTVGQPHDEPARLTGAGTLGRELEAALPLLLGGDSEERREVAELLSGADADGVIALVARALELDCVAKQDLLEMASRASRCLTVSAALSARVYADGGEPSFN